MDDNANLTRCHWFYENPSEQNYHDEEWGVPLYDDKKHFEFLVMEVFQCGLSWGLMMKKRQIFRNCFANHDFNIVANFSDTDVKHIYDVEGMIKSETKIRAIINNAKAFCKIVEEFGSFSNYIWSFSDYKILIYKKHRHGNWETKNDISIALAKDLKKRGCKFLGPVVLYSHLQACGIINDHEPECFRYKAVENLPNVRFLD